MAGSFLQALIPAIGFYLLGLLVAWFIWGNDRSNNA